MYFHYEIFITIKDNNMAKIDFNLTKKKCTQSQIVKAVNLTNKILLDEDIYKNLLLLYEGYSLDYNESFISAFLYGWMLIEKFIGDSWEIYLKNLDRNYEEKRL